MEGQIYASSSFAGVDGSGTRPSSSTQQEHGGGSGGSGGGSGGSGGSAMSPLGALKTVYDLSDSALKEHQV